MATKKKRVPARLPTVDGLFDRVVATYVDRTPEIRQTASGELGPAPASVKIRHTPSGVLDDLASAVDQADGIRGFSPALGWERLRTREPAVHLADLLG